MCPDTETGCLCQTTGFPCEQGKRCPYAQREETARGESWLLMLCVILVAVASASFLAFVMGENSVRPL